MSRIRTAEQLTLIQSIISQHPAGIGVAAIDARLQREHGLSFNRRTLQRRLHALVDAQRIVALGESIAVVYRPAAATASAVAHSAAQTGAQAPAPFSAPARFPFVLSEPDKPFTASPGPAAWQADVQPYVPLSPDSAAVRDHVRQPVMYRRPVAYQRGFLESYQPGLTFYLPEPLRRQLHEIGRTSADERPAGTYARDIMGRLLVDLSWASSRLEGNTYSRLDTQNLIELGQVASGKDAIETQMILNHKAAIEMLIDGADEVDFNPFTFKNLHAVLSQDLMRDPLSSGRLRRRPVDISGTVYSPSALPQVIEDCFEQMLGKLAAIPDPFEQAFFLMVHLPYLQPFEDVNKRVSRIGANISLFRHNLCPLSFIDVPELAYIEGTLGVYELNDTALLRDVFVWAYERSCQRYLAISKTMVAPDPLKIRYREALILAVQSVVKGMQSPTDAVVSELARQHAAAGDEDAFKDMLNTALQQLHEGNIALYRLRRSEYLAWMVGG